MDYLSGKQVGKFSSEKEEQSKKEVFKETLFSNFCKQVTSYLNSDEKARLCDKFLTPEIIEVMKDNELIDCINSFFNNNLNISETSRNAFLHRNTLLYRIEKVNKLTGLNIRNFDDAMSFKLLTLIYNDMSSRMEKK